MTFRRVENDNVGKEGVIMPNFAERLQEQLDDNKITAEKLEKALGFSNSNIYKWLRNESVPNISSLIRLSDYFRCTVDFLSGRATENYYYPKECLSTFKGRLNAAVDERGISDYKFAKSAKLPRTSLHHWLTGRSEPLLDNLIRLADYLDCTIDWLIGRE